MIFIAIIFTALAAVTTIGHSQGPTRITDNKNETLNRVSYQVGLKLSRKEKPCCWECSGVLINSIFVLTTASCTYNASSAEVDLGLLSNTKLSHFVTRENFIEHEGYNDDDTHNHDIALIKIPRVKRGFTLRKVSLPAIQSVYDTYVNRDVAVSRYNKSGNYYFKSVDMKVIKSHVCAKPFLEIHRTHICAESDNISSDYNGGPMVLQSNGQLIGLTLYAGSKGEPSIFLRITSYLDWIAENTGVEYTPSDYN